MSKWLGDLPEKCDICHQEIGKAFVDGRVHGLVCARVAISNMVLGLEQDADKGIVLKLKRS